MHCTYAKVSEGSSWQWECSEVTTSCPTLGRLACLSPARVAEGTKGLRQKVWTRTKLLSPNIHYFVAILRFFAIYALFLEDFLGKKVSFLDNKRVSWARSALLHIAYRTELNLQNCNRVQERCICRENTKYNTRLKKICVGIFALAERRPTSATLEC